jgi:hypothetical protein
VAPLAVADQAGKIELARSASAALLDSASRAAQCSIDIGAGVPIRARRGRPGAIGGSKAIKMLRDRSGRTCRVRYASFSAAFVARWWVGANARNEMIG